MVRYHSKELLRFATELLAAAGLDHARSAIVAETLLEGDLMGHTTHGLALLPAYLGELESGGMETEGEPEVLRDTGGSFSWNGRYLPGPYLVREAVAAARQRIQTHAVVSATIQKAHHIGCLAAYLQQATDAGLMLILACSDPRNATVAPFGGLQGAYSPNPIAAGIPTESDPILIDISMSATANGYIIQQHKAGGKLAHPWLQDAEGKVTNDPAVFFGDPPATILPLGNQDTGYKGFALGILVEALTNALGGFGRSSEPDNWGGSVFLQLIDPEAFGGSAYFRQEMSRFAAEATGNPVPAGAPPVRLPGQRGLNLRREQLSRGVELHPAILPALEVFAQKYGCRIPQKMGKTR